MRDRDGAKAAEKRARRVGWRPPQASEAARNMDEREKELSARGDALEGRLRRHAEEKVNWHKKWGSSGPA